MAKTLSKIWVVQKSYWVGDDAWEIECVFSTEADATSYCQRKMDCGNWDFLGLVPTYRVVTYIVDEMKAEGVGV